MGYNELFIYIYIAIGSLVGVFFAGLYYDKIQEEGDGCLVTIMVIFAFSVFWIPGCAFILGLWIRENMEKKE